MIETLGTERHITGSFDELGTRAPMVTRQAADSWEVRVLSPTGEVVRVEIKPVPSREGTRALLDSSTVWWWRQ